MRTVLELYSAVQYCQSRWRCTGISFAVWSLSWSSALYLMLSLSKCKCFYNSFLFLEEIKQPERKNCHHKGVWFDTVPIRNVLPKNEEATTMLGFFLENPSLLWFYDSRERKNSQVKKIAFLNDFFNNETRLNLCTTTTSESVVVKIWSGISDTLGCFDWGWGFRRLFSRRRASASLTATSSSWCDAAWNNLTIKLRNARNLFLTRSLTLFEARAPPLPCAAGTRMT